MKCASRHQHEISLVFNLMAVKFLHTNRLRVGTTLCRTEYYMDVLDANGGLKDALSEITKRDKGEKD